MSSNYKAGEFFIEAISIVTQAGEVVDITKLVNNFRMYESIYEMFTSADISVVDGVNLLKNFEIVGQENVRISVRQKEGLEDKSDNSQSIDRTFRIYKIHNSQRINETTQAYQFLCQDPRMIQVQKERISQCLYGSYSAMILGILTNSIKLRKEETEAWVDTMPANNQFLAPDMTVYNCIKHMVSNANTSLDAPWRNLCFFYQTLNGGFRFHDIAEMYQREHPVVFTRTPKNVDKENYDININSPRGLNTQILDIHRPQAFDALTGVTSGMYASTLRVWNPITQRVEEHIYNMKDAFNRDGHMHKPSAHIDVQEITATPDDAITTSDQKYSQTDIQPAVNETFDSKIVNVDTMVHSYGNATTLDAPQPFLGETYDDNGILERNALMHLLHQNMYTVVVPFRTDLTVGTIVKLMIPEPETDKPEGTVDKKNDNRYLITEIKLMGKPADNQGTLTMTCVREGISKELEPSVAK